MFKHNNVKPELILSPPSHTQSSHIYIWAKECHEEFSAAKIRKKKKKDPLFMLRFKDIWKESEVIGEKLQIWKIHLHTHKTKFLFPFLLIFW